MCWRLKIVQGGFFLEEKPLGIEVSVKSRIENAVEPHDGWPARKVASPIFFLNLFTHTAIP
jgi:hypothetical protein